MDFRQLLVDAIVGVGFPSIGFAQHCEALGVASFSGDQQSPSWAWNVSALKGFGATELTALYEAISEERDAAEAQAAPQILVPDRTLSVVRN